MYQCCWFAKLNSIKPYESNVGEIKAKVKRPFEDMCDTEDDESTSIDKRRVIVSLDKLKLLRGKVCHAEQENGSFCDAINLRDFRNNRI